MDKGHENTKPEIARAWFSKQGFSTAKEVYRQQNHLDN